MENTLRFVIVFLWCVCFGFFSVMGYLDDAMATSPILAGLLAALVVYCAIEWRPKIKGWQSIRAGWNERIRTLYARLSHGIRASLSFYEHISRGIRTVLHLCARIVRRIRAYVTAINFPSDKIRVYLTSVNLPTWASIKKRFPPTNKPSVSSKGLP